MEGFAPRTGRFPNDFCNPSIKIRIVELNSRAELLLFSIRHHTPVVELTESCRGKISGRAAPRRLVSTRMSQQISGL
jgi:hypothetical protein